MNTMLAYLDVVDFMVEEIRLTELVEFRPSTEAQQRVEALIHMEKHNTLTAAEASELDHYMQVEHIMRLAKAKARAKLATQ